jgi:hypothetical protein
LTETVRRVVTALALSSLALTACGGGKAISGSTTTATGGAAAPSVQPLTCAKVAPGAAATTHPVYIAKIDNTANSNPQYGLGSADFVTEELVEGGITRLAVFYYSKLPAKAGPIRSTRLTDITLAKPLGAQIITSGAAPVTIQGIQQAGIPLIDMNNPHVRRVLDGTHDTLHSVEADVQQIAVESHQASATPKTLLPCGHFVGKTAATSISITFSGTRTSRWTYAGGQYTMTNGYMNAGDVFHPNTIIVVKVDTSNAPYLDPAGNPVPVSHFEGSGKGIIFAGGKALAVTWHKAGTDATPTFTDAAGKPVTITPGRTMLEMIPAGGAVPAGQVSSS